MTFKDLHYSLGKFKTDVRSQLARKNPLQNQDTKALSMWIFEERNDLKAMRVSAYHRNETTKSFLDWIDEHDDHDLQDIGGKLAQLIEMHTEVERDYIARYQKYRRIIKSIRERDDTILSSVREKKRSVEGRLNHLYKSNRKSRKIPQFEQELAQLAKQLEQKEIEMADYKRLALREAFYVRFNALHEYAEKSSLIAGFGNYLVDLLDIEPTSMGDDDNEQGRQKKRKVYNKYQETDMIWMDCKLAVEGWQPNQDDQDVERPTVLEDLLLKEPDDDSGSLLLNDDAEMLTEHDVMTPPPPASSSSSQPAVKKYEEFNEKWTYVATLDQEKKNMNTDKQQELVDPPPAYSPPIGNIVISEKENGNVGNSRNSNNKQPAIDLSHTQPQPSNSTVTEQTPNTNTPPCVCTTTTTPTTLAAAVTTTETDVSPAIIKQQLGTSSSSSNSCHSSGDKNHEEEEHDNSHLATTTTTTYHATDYKDLYEQITQREKTSKPPRPYIEFQQKLLHHHS